MNYILILAATISGCAQVEVARSIDGRYNQEGEPPPEAFLDPIDREIARTGRGTKERPFPCARLKKYGRGIEGIETVETERCVQMDPPQRWTGLWRNQFEGSHFCPHPAATCEHDTPGSSWLTWKDAVASGRYYGELYRVEFIGRQTKYPWRYGHMGIASNEIVVDRMLSVEKVAEPERPDPMPNGRGQPGCDLEKMTPRNKSKSEQARVEKYLEECLAGPKDGKPPAN